MKKLSVKRIKTKKKTLNDNKRNYFNCVSNYNCCIVNISGSEHKYANRREWNNRKNFRS